MYPNELLLVCALTLFGEYSVAQRLPGIQKDTLHNPIADHFTPNHLAESRKRKEYSRADIIVRIGEEAFRYGTRLGLERGKQLVMEAQPLKGLSHSSDEALLSDFEVRELALNFDRSKLDFQEKTVTLKAVADKIHLRAKYVLHEVQARGPLDIWVNDLEFTLAVNISISADELIPFLQSEPACDAQVDKVEAKFWPNPYARCEHLEWYEQIFCYPSVVIGAPVFALLDLIATAVADSKGSALIKEHLGPAICRFVNAKLMPGLKQLLDEAKTALKEASIAVPIVRDVNMSISQKGIRSVQNGVVSLPLAVVFKYGSPEMPERAKVIASALDQCPASDSSFESATTDGSMLSLVFTSSFLQHLVGVILASDFSFNGDATDIGKYLRIADCPVNDPCLATLLGLPASDPSLKRAKHGMECRIQGSLDTASDVCHSRVSALDNAVYAVVPLELHCIARLVEPNEELKILQSGVLLKVSVGDIRIASNRSSPKSLSEILELRPKSKSEFLDMLQGTITTQIFVGDNAEIKLDVAFRNSSLLFNSTTPDFSPPSDVSVPLGMAWDFAKGFVLKFVRQEVAKGIEVPKLGPVRIEEASILTGDKALANGDDVLTAVANFKLNI